MPHRNRQLTDRLRRTRTFARCSTRGLHTVVRAATEVVIPPNWAFLHEATPAHEAYVLLDGEATVFRGREPVGSVHDGDLVGELGLLNHRLRTATVTSGRRITALRIDYDTLDRVLRDEPDVAAEVRAVAAERTVDSSA